MKTIIIIINIYSYSNTWWSANSRRRNYPNSIKSFLGKSTTNTDINSQEWGSLNLLLKLSRNGRPWMLKIEELSSKILLKTKSYLMTNRNHLKRKNLQALLKKRKKSLNPKVKLSPVLQIHHPNKKLFKFFIVLPVQKRRKHNLNHLISQEMEPKKISKSVNQTQKSWVWRQEKQKQSQEPERKANSQEPSIWNSSNSIMKSWLNNIQDGPLCKSQQSSNFSGRRNQSKTVLSLEALRGSNVNSRKLQVVALSVDHTVIMVLKPLKDGSNFLTRAETFGQTSAKVWCQWRKKCWARLSKMKRLRTRHERVVTQVQKLSLAYLCINTWNEKPNPDISNIYYINIQSSINK